MAITTYFVSSLTTPNLHKIPNIQKNRSSHIVYEPLKQTHINKPVRRTAARRMSLPGDVPDNCVGIQAAWQGRQGTPQLQPSLLVHATSPVV